MEHEHFEIKQLNDFAVDVLTKKGWPKRYAKATAYALLTADERGIFSHGLAGGTSLEENVKKTGVCGTVNFTAVPELKETKYPTLAVIKCNGAPGHITSQIAVDWVKETARKFGMAKVYTTGGNHYGAAGVWSHLIAEDKDLEGVVTCTTAAVTRPLGDDIDKRDYTKGAGQEIRTGTNPEAISIPHNEGILTMDMALTRMAVSYAMKCLKAGDKVNMPGYMADINHKSTFNPRDIFYTPEEGKRGFRSVNGNDAGVFQLGSEAAGYKGDAKLRMIEVDNALGGGPIIKVNLGTTNPEERISHTFMAQAVDFHYSKNDALAKVSALMNDYRKYFGKASRWCGDRAIQATKYVQNEGVPYSEGQIATLERAAADVEMEFNVKSLGKKEFPWELFNK